MPCLFHSLPRLSFALLLSDTIASYTTSFYFVLHSGSYYDKIIAILYVVIFRLLNVLRIM